MTQMRKGFHRHALAAAVVLALAATAAQAQVSTATLRGQVTAGNIAARPGLSVVAVNKDNGNTYRTSTLADGSYVLPGMAPGRYEIRIGGGQSAEVITLEVGQTASLDLRLPDSGTQTITVIGASSRQGVKDSQVGTTVSRKLIDTLPQSTHNFMSSADLAPGVAFQTDGNGNATIQSGAQNFDHVNVFIDGVGQKNDILRGGMVGQDSSRGNPFPQSAIAEYKVLTQNYKAEFDQVSSAAITAVTRSGTNELHGDAYFDRTGTDWRALTPFEKQNEAATGLKLPPSTQDEFGFDLGGPIKKDQVHFFFAYDGKNINDSRIVSPQHLADLPNAGIVPTLVADAGSTIGTFHEDLLFGKVDAQINDENKLTLSAKLRREKDHLPENSTFSAPGNDKSRTNDETSINLLHEWSRGDLLSEARLGHEEYEWSPHSSATTPFIKYQYSNANPPMLTGAADVIYVGGSPDSQDRAQKSNFVSEDLTWTGAKGHVIKGGAKFNAMSYSLSGTAFSVDTVTTVIDPTTGDPYYANGLCTGTNIINNGLNSDQCSISKAIPGSSVKFNNNQIGLYLQDDWSVNKQLELNLGVRWDYESNMLNNSYVTPADRVAALMGLDTRTGFTDHNGVPIVVPPGQTYAQSLAKGGVNIGDYIADGHSRKPYTGAFAPRLGASYDLKGDKSSVIYGGWGRSYDRQMANNTLDELQKNSQPGGEIWLIKNDFKMPYADQFSIGLRQALGAWNADIALSQIHAKNQFTWFSGNRDPNGGYANQSIIDPLWGGPNGYGSLVLGAFVDETKTNSVLGKLEKPYTKASGYGVTVAYTYSDAQTTNKEWANDIFDWTYGKPGRAGWNPSKLVDKNRIVAAGVVDLPWGMTVAPKMTWASGLPRLLTDCSAGWNNCVYREGQAPSFRQFDISLSKAISAGPGKLTLRMDVLNLFNTYNYGGFDDWVGSPRAAGDPTNRLGGNNPNLDTPNAIRGNPRTVRLGLGYSF